MSKIKVAVIGCGNIATAAHIPAYLKLADECEIKYFCDIVFEKAEKCVEEYKCGTAVKDYHEVLADPEIEAVSVCVPNIGHKIIAVDALRAGKNVLCEKPAARILSEAEEMKAVRDETGKVLCIGVCTRFHKGVEAVRDMIANGELGEVYHVFCSFRSFRSIPGLGGPFTTKELSGGGTLIDWGVHRIDQILYMTGDPTPKSVSAATFCKLGVDMKNYKHRGMWSEATSNLDGTYDVDDSCSVFMRTTGPIVTLEGAWAQNIDREEQYVDFMGTKAGVRLNYCGGYTKFSIKDGEFVEEAPELPAGDMYADEIKEFFRAIETGEKTRHDIDYAIITSRVLQAAYDSSDEGREIIL